MASGFFIVRVWREPERQGRAGWRAIVRPVDAEQGREFTGVHELASYLAENAGEVPPGTFAARESFAPRTYDSEDFQ